MLTENISIPEAIRVSIGLVALLGVLWSAIDALFDWELVRRTKRDEPWRVTPSMEVVANWSLVKQVLAALTALAILLAGINGLFRPNLPVTAGAWSLNAFLVAAEVFCLGYAVANTIFRRRLLDIERKKASH